MTRIIYLCIGNAHSVLGRAILAPGAAKPFFDFALVGDFFRRLLLDWLSLFVSRRDFQQIIINSKQFLDSNYIRRQC